MNNSVAGKLIRKTDELFINLFLFKEKNKFGEVQSELVWVKSSLISELSMTKGSFTCRTAKF